MRIASGSAPIRLRLKEQQFQLGRFTEIAWALESTKTAFCSRTACSKLLLDPFLYATAGLRLTFGKPHVFR